MSFKKYLLAGLTLLSLNSPTYAPSKDNYSSEIAKNELIKEIQLKEKEKKELEKHYALTDSIINEAPTKYIDTKTKRRLLDQCSGYVQRAGSELFNKYYSYSDAWDRKYRDKLVYEFKSKKFDHEGKKAELDSLFKIGELERGLILAFYNPRSEHNKKGRDWTHVTLGVGYSKDGEYYVIENRAKHQGKTKLSELNEKGYDLRAILDENIELLTEK